MSNDLENQLLMSYRKMDQLLESNKALTASNLELAQAINQQTMAIHALAASNEEIVNVLAQAVIDDEPDGNIPDGATLDPIQQQPEQPEHM